ncbi:M61 family metallopeptidase [Robertkochia aurantiaca]|uniref:M61 family metallopeptidase n=1 Tax=Robertkochia aurantiaca TaxID=2873700 RepID=UPI001CCD8675|nr:PDZ domain-containing protein [Robertkochia sp. 3YJGBD-33]
MNIRLVMLAFLLAALPIRSQEAIHYHISFDNAIHHLAEIDVSFTQLEGKDLSVRMARSSPGRYAIHEFAKNVFGFTAVNSKGDTLQTERPDPYSWTVKEHDGTVKVSYYLFANRADGTYSQIDETHAHLNMPATFMFAPEYAERPIDIFFEVREDLNWKVATQLKQTGHNRFSAPDLQYFMDSPTEISDFKERSFIVEGKTGKQEISFVLHDNASESTFDDYFEKVKKIVLEERKVFGELPEFDYDRYTFIACYTPGVSGDGMEHRNSTILTSTLSIEEGDGGFERNIGTVSHEFFHAWNVERIRPDSLEPFDFTGANMSGALWFAEGFTSYYTSLMLIRPGIIDIEDYLRQLNRTFNYVWTSPARTWFNPVEMSYQAPFVDAATAIDPTNFNNTFISYYSYGSMLGLALDLKLRQKGLTLDEYMKTVWEAHGKKEEPYTLQDLQSLLAEYAGSEFANDFFNNYIFKSRMPDYHTLFETVGFELKFEEGPGETGVKFKNNRVTSTAKMGSPAWKAGIGEGDTIISVNGLEITDEDDLNEVLKDYQAGNTLKLTLKRNGRILERELQVEKNNDYIITIAPDVTKKQLKARASWLEGKD